ncbi:MAG: M28 family peptidase [Thermoguttaceae bacterium]
MPKYTRLHCISLLVLLLSVSQSSVLAAEKNTAYQTAIDSIVAEEMFQTVDALASPKFEGREAGSTGGRAAGDYLVEQFRKLPLQPAGVKQGYFQPFGYNYRNILALLPGSDPSFKDQTIVVGAHYDHLGHGNPHNNPPGTIYPGADDNASGTSGVLELARAFSSLPTAPRRSILFICFDGEEKGLLGSKHWTADPTLPLSRVKFMLNLDMIGALRAERVLVFGSRTASGLRRMASECNQDEGLTLDFSWLMQGNADHYSFYDRGIPTLFLHTDLHERYHRPTDVAAKINRDGMMRVARLAFAIVYEMAEVPMQPRFRMAAKAENEDAHRRLEVAEPIAQRAGDPPMRLGIAWRTDDAEPDTVIVSHVAAGSAAATAGLRVGDRIYRIGGRDFADDTAFAQLARTLPGPLELLVERDGRLRTVVLYFPQEAGKGKKTA